MILKTLCRYIFIYSHFYVSIQHDDDYIRTPAGAGECYGGVATSLPPLIATPPTIHRWKEQFNLFKTLKQLQQRQYWRCQCSTAPAAPSFARS